MAAKVLSSVRGSKVIVSSCPAHIVSSRRHSLKNEPEVGRVFCKAILLG